jgi:hypothetical protein
LGATASFCVDLVRTKLRFDIGVASALRCKYPETWVALGASKVFSYVDKPTANPRLENGPIMSMPLIAALTSSALLGFRHGFDYDHIAAIGDITSVQRTPREAMRLGLLYALGHAATVAALGGAVILFQKNLPASVDRFAERAVGLTLVLLSFYVLSCLVRRKHTHASLSRIAVAVNAARWTGWRLRSFFREGEAPPQPVRWTYQNRSAFGIGVIHGVGAETPSQLFVFLLAANLGGVSWGFLGLAMFIAGLLLMNTVMTASATGLFRVSLRRPVFVNALSYATAAYSFLMGIIFLFGASSMLPPLEK